MKYLTSKDISEQTYDVLSDYINNNMSRVPVEQMEPEELHDIELQDCYFNDNGDLFVPVSYDWVYRGTQEEDDRDEYKPIYSKIPTLTSKEVENLVTII